MLPSLGVTGIHKVGAAYGRRRFSPSGFSLTGSGATLGSGAGVVTAGATAGLVEEVEEVEELDELEAGDGLVTVVSA